MGDTREELLANAPDAIRAHIAASRELGLAVHELGENLAQVEVLV
jgi:predicted RNase H-like HicB family nuclease